MAVTVNGTGITFANGTVQTTAATAGISAQNCSYTGGVVESAAIYMQMSNPQTIDLGSNRVVTGMRKINEGCVGFVLYLRGYNIKNTA